MARAALLYNHTVVSIGCQAAEASPDAVRLPDGFQLTSCLAFVHAEHIVPVGLIAPDHVVTPAPLIDYLVANK